MAAKSSAVATPKDLTLEITRVFDAPRSLVFQTWTDPKHLSRWSAPKGFKIPESSGEIRPGGSWRVVMVAPDSSMHIASGVYREIVKDERIVFTHAWDDANGKRGHETVVTVTLADEGKKTRMSFVQGAFNSAESRDGHNGGWSEGFDKLADLLRDLQK